MHMFNKIKKTFNIVLLFIACFITISFMQNHESRLFYKLPCCVSSIFSADIDLDGDNDIITGHSPDEDYSDTGVVILRNDSHGLMDSTYESLELLAYQYDIIVTDLTGDQYPEIVAFKTSDGYYIRVYYNTDGFFTQFSDFPMNISKPVWAKTYGDMDGDNDVDILIASANAYKWGIMTNNGSGILSAPEYFTIDYKPVDIKCADLNNDSLNDVIVAGTDNTLFLNMGNGFQEIIFEDDHLQHVEIDDFNNDGINDVVGIESFWNTSLYFYENNWDTTFTKHTALVYDSVLDNPVVGDINNDSLPDVICTSFSGVFVMKNNGDFSLELPDYYPFPLSYFASGYAYCSDLDNSGWMDIASVLQHPQELTTQLMTLYNDGTGYFVENPVTGINNPKLESQKAVLQCYPNPFQNKVSISIKIDNATKAKVKIANLTGREIKTIYIPILNPGKYEFNWDGKSNTGYSCPKGTYLVVLETDEFTKIKKIIFN